VQTPCSRFDHQTPCVATQKLKRLSATSASIDSKSEWEVFFCANESP
jgi:hypothetical protein